MRREHKTALQKATDLLARQEQSSAELRRKLLARKYDGAEVETAIDKLKQYNYLDDEQACRRRFEQLYSEGKLSVKQICAKLYQRGFDLQLIESLIPDDSDEHDRQVAQILLSKKFKAGGDRSKAWQFLATKGFGADAINSAVDRWQEEMI